MNVHAVDIRKGVPVARCYDVMADEDTCGSCSFCWTTQSMKNRNVEHAADFRRHEPLFNRTQVVVCLKLHGGSHSIGEQLGARGGHLRWRMRRVTQNTWRGHPDPSRR